MCKLLVEFRALNERVWLSKHTSICWYFSYAARGMMCVIPVVFLTIVRSYVWITRNQTQQFLTSIINIIRYQQQLHVSALHVGHHQVVTLDLV